MVFRFSTRCFKLRFVRVGPIRWGNVTSSGAAGPSCIPAITLPQFAQCWSLDETGNWSGFRQSDNGSTWTLEQERAANEANEIAEITNTVGSSWSQPAYDPAGNMTTVPRPATPGSSYTATYDAWNRLVKLQAGGQTVQENAYDARNFRVVRKDYSAGILSETRHAYFTDSWQVVEERLGSSTSPDRHFVWGQRYLDDLILRDRTTGGTLSERLYALQDANWNVTAVTNSSGSVQERYEYDPYGQTTVLTAAFGSRGTSSYGWETTYAGYRWDGNTGLFAVRNRYYNATVGTWVSRDPVLYTAGTLNLYEYLKGASLSTSDPSGLGGYWEGVGDVFKGYGDAATGTVQGIGTLLSTNPVTTAQNLGSAVYNYDRTFNAIASEVSQKMGSNRGIGSLVGDVGIGIATGGTIKAASKAGTIGKIVAKLRGKKSGELVLCTRRKKNPAGQKMDPTDPRFGKAETGDAVYDDYDNPFLRRIGLKKPSYPNPSLQIKGGVHGDHRAAVMRNEQAHMSDFRDHPSLTHLANRPFLFPGTGTANLIMEYRANLVMSQGKRGSALYGTIRDVDGLKVTGDVIWGAGLGGGAAYSAYSAFSE